MPETEASETNDCEGPTINTAAGARACLSVRAISERLQIRKTTVATYLLRAREAGLSWPLPLIYEGDGALERALFRRVGRPPQDFSEPAGGGAGAQA